MGGRGRREAVGWSVGGTQLRLYSSREEAESQTWKRQVGWKGRGRAFSHRKGCILLAPLLHFDQRSCSQHSVFAVNWNQKTGWNLKKKISLGPNVNGKGHGREESACSMAVDNVPDTRPRAYPVQMNIPHDNEVCSLCLPFHLLPSRPKLLCIRVHNSADGMC